MMSREFSDVEASSAHIDDSLADHEENVAPVLAQRETMAVRHLKVCVALILLLATILVSGFAYWYTKTDEVAEFEGAFAGYTLKIIETVNANAEHKLEAISALALEIQAFAMHDNLTWPFVTMPLFEERVMASQSLLDAYGVVFFPIVDDSHRAEWETYSVANRQWINASYAAQRYHYGADNFESKINDTSNADWYEILWSPKLRHNYTPDFSPGISSTIFKTRHADDPDNRDPAVDDTAGPYFPQWQTAPMSWYYQTTVNCNYAHYADFLEQTKVVIEKGSAAFGEAWTDGNAPGFLSTLLYPIFDTLYDDEKSIVGFLSIDIFWQAFLRDILPPNNDAIYVVIENTCNQSFTYILRGKNATFVGEGDMHETNYDDFQISTIFGQPLMEPSPGAKYVGVRLDNGSCPYTFNMYPSEEMEHNYVSKMPVLLSVAACSIFFFTSVVFLTYDILVERRQKLVMHSATRADKIVSSLFPDAVKDRVYEGHSEGNVLRQLSFMNVQGTNDTVDTNVSPIAELYPETTVLFADIAGFTAWSSNRQPSDVFLFLETIFRQFDLLAKKRGVFKIETIGDCYVAVTGIPRPQQDHAVIMVRFARSCLLAFKECLLELSEKLSFDTVELGLRIGIHSGPVTAGVLRGEKARFQLFGDTVNTASRMESNGVAHRIHISEATAKLLQKDGKEQWLKLRKDTIWAKGKGEMKTYWINGGWSRTEKESAPTSSKTSGSDATERKESALNEWRDCETNQNCCHQRGPNCRDDDDDFEDFESLSKKLHQRIGACSMMSSSQH